MRKQSNNLKIGAYTPMESFSSAVEFIKGMGGNVFMSYTGPPQSVYRKPTSSFGIEKGIELMKELGVLDMVVHAPYIINLGTPNQEKNELAQKVLFTEVERCIKFEASHLVLHTGFYKDTTRESAMYNIINAINSSGIDKLLLGGTLIIVFETMCGKGTELGAYFEELGWLLKSLPENLQPYFGVCLDTCHVWDAGYDISQPDIVLEHFEKTVGLKNLHVVHVNGSLNGLGSHKDRHANIGADDSNFKGKDFIGADTIYNFVNHPMLQEKIFILETPWSGDKPMYKEEIEFLNTKR